MSSVAKARAGLSLPIKEIIDGFRNWPFWLTLAWTDIRGRYRRTLLGPFWTALNSFVFIVIMSIVYSKLWKTALPEFLPFVASGYFVWSFFTTNVVESCQAFYSNGEALKSTGVSPISMMFRVVARNTIVFLHNLVILILIFLFFGRPFELVMLLAIPGLVLLGLFCAGLGTCLALTCARFRDIEQIISSVLLILFFITPILWRPELLPEDSRFLADWNLAYHLISVARDPLLSKWPGTTSITVAAVATAVALVAGIISYVRLRGRLPYWL